MYSETVKKLINLGHPSSLILTTKWPDYEFMGITKEDIPELIKLLTDEELYYSEEDNPKIWACLHAWRALGQLKAEEAIIPLFQTLRMAGNEDDWAREEISTIWGMIGEASIPALKEHFLDTTEPDYIRLAALDGIKEVGLKVPSCEKDCITIFTDYLKQSTTADEELNGFIIANLLDLKAVSAIDDIREAFKRDVVDFSIAGDLEEVEMELGLRETRSTPKPNYRFARPRVKKKKTGRNEPCPCGSGKKYKKCCL